MQVGSPAPAGSLTEVRVAATALSDNRLGDPTQVRVAVYVPPGYGTNQQRRYPTLYLLHRYTSDIDAFTRGYQGIDLARTMDVFEGAGRVG